MGSTLHVSGAWLAMTAVAALLVIVLPFILGVMARKQLAVGWRYFWFGTIVFLVSQVLTRLPAILVLQGTMLAPLLRSSTTFTWIWLAILAVTAGLFEEVGRYVGYRVFLRREAKSWSKAVMYGLGHEGLESVLLAGGGLVLTLVSVIILTSIPLNSLPADQRPTAVQQIAAINAQAFWSPLLAVWERLWSFPMQVALAVIVLQVFLRHQLRWLGLAILLHAFVDFVAVGVPQAFGHSTLVTTVLEGIVCVFGLVAVWIIWRLRASGADTGSREGASLTNTHRTSPLEVVSVAKP